MNNQKCPVCNCRKINEFIETYYTCDSCGFKGHGKEFVKHLRIHK